MRAYFLSLSLPLLLVGCFQDSTPQPSQFVPLDYPAHFQQTRDCRLNVGHQNSYMKVLVNDSAADAYAAAVYPLAPGSVVVAEDYGNDPSCGALADYDVMGKEQAGYNPEAADWHWQRLDANKRIEQDGKL